MKPLKPGLKPLALAAVVAMVPMVVMASSHREAPFVAAHPTVDATDFYMFMSYGPNAPKGYVTLIANYHPFENPWGGPNYYQMNQNAAYDIRIDNNGDAKPDRVFRFKFKNTFKNVAVPAGKGKTAVPLINIGPIMGTSGKNRNRSETYTVTQYAGSPRHAHGQKLVSGNGSKTFTVPEDNIGNKSIPNYQQYANQFVYKNVQIPNCSKPAKVFVGQRKDPFVVNLGEIFDLVNTAPGGSPYGAHNTLTYDNVTAIAMAIPASCLTESSKQPIIGAWTTASLRQARVINPTPTDENSATVVGGAYTQVSRLGAPLVNEVVIGLPDKNRFNASQPQDDAQFLHYVTNPSLPVLLHVLFPSATTVPDTPRNDLVAAFLTGIKGLNQPSDLSAPGEELRLNTSIPPTKPAQQKVLGVLGGDLAGFPNGRRPYDDVVDIELRVAEGILCGYNKDMNCGSQTKPQNAGVPFTDGARSPGPTAVTEQVKGYEYTADTYLDHFPYLAVPLPGSPNGKNGTPSD